MAVALRALNRWVILAVAVVGTLYGVHERLAQLSSSGEGNLVVPALRISAQPLQAPAAPKNVR
ncbi:MAG TPA: hypothetical protein VNJ51_05995 [Candidatus Dormibacteraeota bacterium]|nr:hypothetical protein [Candidatus Dormibacteraeota bacterium]